MAERERSWRLMGLWLGLLVLLVRATAQSGTMTCDTEGVCVAEELLPTDGGDALEPHPATADTADKVEEPVVFEGRPSKPTLTTADNSVILENPPKTVKLGEVIDNLAQKVPPELPARMAEGASYGQAMVGRLLGKARDLLAPHLEKVVKVGSDYGLGELSASDLDLQRRCAEGTGGTACHFLNVSVSLWSQLSSVGKEASGTTVAWLSKEVPNVALPFHLLWMEVDVEVTPINAVQDVKSIILKQKPFFAIRYLDKVSEFLVRSCHAVPYFDYIINARYDLFYWPDPACPLEATGDGIIVRKPFTPDGYCAIRPCEAQASLPGSNRWSLDGSSGSNYCECDLPAHRCKVRADALRSFALAADGPLSQRPFTATCSSRTLWATPPDWLPASVKPYVRMVPAYLLNSVLGLGMAMLADTVSESVVVHLGVSALLGLFSILLLVAFVVNSLLRTVRSLQPVSGITTVLSSAALVLFLQRFSQVSPLQQTLTMLQLCWNDYPLGRYIMLTAMGLGVVLKLSLGWFTTPEDEAEGWVKKALNGRWWLRRLVYGGALYLLLHSAPNPDWALLITIAFLSFSWIRFGMWRAHMALQASPDTSRFIAQSQYGEGDVSLATKRELEKLRAAMQSDPALVARLSDKTRGRADEFSRGRDHILAADVQNYEEEFGPNAMGRRGACNVQ